MTIPDIDDIWDDSDYATDCRSFDNELFPTEESFYRESKIIERELYSHGQDSDPHGHVDGDNLSSFTLSSETCPALVQPEQQTFVLLETQDVLSQQPFSIAVREDAVDERGDVLSVVTGFSASSDRSFGPPEDDAVDGSSESTYSFSFVGGKNDDGHDNELSWELCDSIEEDCSSGVTISTSSKFRDLRRAGKTGTQPPTLLTFRDAAAASSGGSSSVKKEDEALFTSDIERSTTKKRSQLYEAKGKLSKSAAKAYWDDDHLDSTQMREIVKCTAGGKPKHRFSELYVVPLN